MTPMRRMPRIAPKHSRHHRSKVFLAHRGIPGNEASRHAAGGDWHRVSSTSFHATQESETERERMPREKPEAADRSVNCHHHLDLPRQPLRWLSHRDRPPRSDLTSHPPNNSKHCRGRHRLDCRGAIRQIAGSFRRIRVLLFSDPSPSRGGRPWEA